MTMSPLVHQPRTCIHVWYNVEYLVRTAAAYSHASIDNQDER